MDGRSWGQARVQFRRNGPVGLLRFGRQIVEQPIGVPDIFATVFKALGIDHRKELHAGERPVPITDRGTPLAQLFS